MQERLIADLKQALLAKDSRAVSVLRMLKSELHNAQISSGKELDEAETLKVLRKEIKKRTEASAAYTNAGSPERAQEEELEAEVLRKYLPPQADIAQVEAFVREVISGLEDRSPRQKGVVIQQVLAKFAGQVESSEVAGLVNRLLTEA